MISEPLAVCCVLASALAFAIWLEQRFSAFKKVGAAALVILMGMVFSNTGILPGESPTYDFLMSWGVSAGIVLILLSIDIRSVLSAGPEMLKAFGIGALGSIIGSSLMAFLLADALGPESWKLAGQFTGTYIGGGMNFAALGQAFETSSDLFTAAIAADVIVTALWLLVCLTVPILLGKKSTTSQSENDLEQDTAEVFTLEKALYQSKHPLHMLQIGILVSLTLATLWVSDLLVNLIPLLPKVIWLSLISILLAQIPAVKKLSGSAMLGNYLVLLFLASNGAKSVVANIVAIGPNVFYYAIGTVAIHGLAIFGLGKLFKLDMGTLAIASQANIGGSSSAMALASARGYSDRLLAGIAVGLLGYAIGNFLGLGVGSVMRGIL